MKKSSFLLFLLIFLAILLASCVESNHSNLNTNNTLIVEDDFGYKIVIKGVPSRIVSLAPSNTEILFALGLGDKIVGVTDYCNYPPQALNKTKIGGYSTINIERVIALKPDLVVAAYGNGRETVETLRKFNITVVALNPKNVKDIERDILLLGKITGTEDNATKLVRWMEEKIEYIKKKVKGRKKVSVAHILWHDPIWVSGKNTFIDEVISIAGGCNVFDFEGWKIVSIEDLIEKNPEVIIVSSGSGMGGKRDVVYEWVVSDERLRGIDAVKNNRVYVVNADIISRPSYRIVFAIEKVAKLLHPNAFEKLVLHQSQS